MIALRVTLNGKLVCVAGADDLAVLNTIVGAVGNLGSKTKRQRDEPMEIYLSVGGLTARAEGRDENLDWTERLELRTGDRIEVEVMEAREVDPPKRRKGTETPEERERFRFEHAKKEYLALHSKFDGE